MNITADLESDIDGTAATQLVSQEMFDPFCREKAQEIYEASQDLVPVDTGALKESGHIEEVGSAVGEGLWYVVYDAPTKDQSKWKSYACVLGASTQVAVKGGERPIGQIKVGDLVLTQTGEYKHVIATNRFPATKKPELVEITTEYRKGRNHVLTVTTDHKILTYRDGRNTWIQAGDLKETDVLYSRIKKAHNKGKFIDPAKTCINCGVTFNRHTESGSIVGQGKYFCTPECHADYWSKGNNPHIGMKRSQETKDRIAAKNRERFKVHPEQHPNYIVNKKGFKTDAEKEVESWLISAGNEYHTQHKIGQHFADFYLPEENIVIEVDGAYWHKDQIKDIERDAELKETDPSLTIVHVHYFDKRHSPKLELMPLEDVYYVPCNPGMHSFVDPSTFKQAKILKLRHFTYANNRTNKPTMLYDLTIEDVHSFYAAGILVSNSFVELGTSRMSAEPYLVPAMAQVMGKL